MNTQEYIESGILEAYVAGLLSEEEMKEIDRLSANDPIIRQEIEDIRLALKAFQPVAKGPALPALESILEAADEQEPIEKQLYPDEKQKSVSPLYWLGIAASWLLLIGAIAVIINLNNRVEQLATEVDSLRDSQLYAQKQYNVVTEAPVVIEKENEVLTQDALETVAMKSVVSDSSYLVHVFWNKASQDVYLRIENLPPPPDGHQYQLWAIVDGVSLDAGIFEHHKKMQRLRKVGQTVSAFAVTLEEDGGNPVPHLERMFVKGDRVG